MFKYIVKRILLAAFSLFLIATVCFMLIRVLPMELPNDKNLQEIILARWEALGYDKPLLIQYGIYLKNIFTAWDFGTSWQVSYLTPAWQVITDRLLPTVLVNLYALVFSVPIGLLFGVLAALYKNRWQDNLISTGVMVFVSIPSYVYAFLVQFLLYFVLDAFPLHVYSLADAGGSYFTFKMFYSMIPPVLALSFGEIAGLCRFTRAELSEALTADYMLFARAKGLTKKQATLKHAFKNAMVPILPMIISSFALILGGSLVIEQIFSIPGVGQLYVKSINLRDYDVFMANSIFYTFVGLLAGIIVDVSYGFLDPRIRMGEK